MLVVLQRSWSDLHRLHRPPPPSGAPDLNDEPEGLRGGQVGDVGLVEVRRQRFGV
jgi:hypothetical protein